MKGAIMRRVLAAVFLAIHGAIHLMGPIDFWKIADIDGISPPNASGAVVGFLGALWLAAAVGFIGGAALFWRDDRRWRPVVISAAVLSFIIAGAVWQDAWAGMIVNVVIVLAALPGKVYPRYNAAPADGTTAREHVTRWRPFGRRVDYRAEAEAGHVFE
jgi:hypothetical protein